MQLKTDLIELSLDDDPGTFFKKLGYISRDKISEQVQRFEKYDKYATLLKFHLEALRQPESNIRLVHHEARGWHTSSCIQSLPDQVEPLHAADCTCEKDFDKPSEFFSRMRNEL